MTFGLELASSAVLWLGLACIVIPKNNYAFDQVLPIVNEVQNRNLGYATQIRKCLPQVPKGARILLVDDPYPEDRFIPLFLIRETYDDTTLVVDRSRSLRLQGVEQNLDSYDLTVSYSEERCQVTWLPPRTRE